jgi:uncharacterized membrane protein YczE
MAEIGNLPLRHRPVRRLLQLYAGLWLYGASMALMVRSRLGLDPWDVFHQGVSRGTGLDMGWVVIGVGAAVLLLWIPLRQRPGVGTVSNVVVIGLALDATLWAVPAPGALPLRIALLVGGVVANGVAGGLYLGARLGPGPRDGLMTGLVGRFAGRRFVSIRVVRTAIELTVLAFGWLLGGTVGVGTVLYAVAIGPLAHVFIPLFAVEAPPPAPAPAGTPAPGGHPGPGSHAGLVGAGSRSSGGGLS